MKFTISRTVELTEKDYALLRLLGTEGWQWNYATPGYELEDFDNLVGEGLAQEDADGRVKIKMDGRQVLTTKPENEN